MRGKTWVSYLLRSQNLNGTVSAITNVNNKNEKRLGGWRKADGFQGEIFKENGRINGIEKLGIISRNIKNLPEVQSLFSTL